ncbi:MAG: fused response regulator/phosphatase [Planctomycetes bacterium]|nr:fused response regulator/phosphatase [Planctomycetota bacterium]
MKPASKHISFYNESEKSEKPKAYLKPWKVMIVDDDDDVHALTRMVFRNLSFENKHLAFISAYSGKECEEMLLDHPDTAMILIDVVMEDHEAGLRTVKRIRNYLRNSMVRIIVRTGQPGHAPEENVIVDYDINDYVSKTEPFSRLLTAVITSLRSYRDLKLRKEVGLAAAMEDNLFPQSFPKYESYDFSARTQMAGQAGGDLFDIQPLDKHRSLIAIGDVSGKGLPAALYVTAVLSIIRTQIECYLDNGISDQIQPAQLMTILNRLLRKVMQKGKFVSMFICLFDSQKHELSYCCAGHCPGVVIHNDNQKEIFSTHGIVCGLCDTQFEDQIEQKTLKIQPGDYIMLCTDGMAEAENIHGKMYGEDRYYEMLTLINSPTSAENAISHIWGDVNQYMSGTEASDDRTMICLRRLEA